MHKTKLKWSLLQLFFAVLFLMVILYLTGGFYKKYIERKQTQQNRQPAIANKQIRTPVRLKIPNINVDAFIENVGVTSEGAMEVPNNITDVGWFDLGPHPGERGSAVIAGHLDGKDGEPGVFLNLHKLKKGDTIYVEDNSGKSIAFLVREIHTYDPGFMEKVFSSSDSDHLNLITCSGIWDKTEKSYTKRLVVFADSIP